MGIDWAGRDSWGAARRAKMTTVLAARLQVDDVIVTTSSSQPCRVLALRCGTDQVFVITTAGSLVLAAHARVRVANWVPGRAGS